MILKIPSQLDIYFEFFLRYIATFPMLIHAMKYSETISTAILLNYRSNYKESYQIIWEQQVFGLCKTVISKYLKAYVTQWRRPSAT